MKTPGKLFVCLLFFVYTSWGQTTLPDGYTVPDWALPEVPELWFPEPPGVASTYGVVNPSLYDPVLLYPVMWSLPNQTQKGYSRQILGCEIARVPEYSWFYISPDFLYRSSKMFVNTYKK